MIIPRLYELYSANGTELCESYANMNPFTKELIDNDMWLESGIHNYKFSFEEKVADMDSKGDRIEEYVEWVCEKYPVYYKIYLEHEEWTDYELVEEGEIPIDNARVAEILKGWAA